MKGMVSIGLAARALRSRNYRLFFGGQSISLTGTWITRVATGWLVYRLTGSAALLGIVGFCGQAPAFFLGPLSGVWVDRWDRHRALVATQALSMLQSFALAALALSGTIRIGHIVALSLAQGAINAFDMPARQAFVVQMVERREDLGNAIALNSSMVNAARLIGPAIAGVIIAAFGEGMCFLLDGFSYVAVIGSLLAMRVVSRPARATRRKALQELGEGWRYVAGSKAIHSILLLLALVSLVGMPYTVLMPIFASEVFGGGPYTLGFLMSASGAGALVGALSLAMRRSVVGLGRRIVVATAMFGTALICFALSQWLWLALLLLPFAGFGMMQQMASGNTILQTIVDDEKRGRVMAYYAMAFQGMVPFGSLFAGGLTARIGAPRTLVIGGAACIGGAIWFARRLPAIRAAVRPRYAELGILPELQGVHNASSLQQPPQN
ncbi:MAG: MFS transporter [Bryobacteraceae bacterium]|nr:MFS transporter [Bryobacteraceae bacterium]